MPTEANRRFARMTLELSRLRRRERTLEALLAGMLDRWACERTARRRAEEREAVLRMALDGEDVHETIEETEPCPARPC